MLPSLLPRRFDCAAGAAHERQGVGAEPAETWLAHDQSRHPYRTMKQKLTEPVEPKANRDWFRVSGRYVRRTGPLGGWLVMRMNRVAQKSPKVTCHEHENARGIS